MRWMCSFKLSVRRTLMAKVILPDGLSLRCSSRASSSISAPNDPCHYQTVLLHGRQPPASPRRATEPLQPTDGATGAPDEHCLEPGVQPSARRSCALRVTTIPCSSSSTVCADPHAPRPWPGPQYMLRSAAAVGLAKRGRIPPKTILQQIVCF